MRYQLVGAGKGSAPRPVDQERFAKEYDRIFGEKPLPNEKEDVSRGKVLKDKHSTLDNSESSISRMMKDRVMVRMIREGKVEDPGLKREAVAIERENSTRPRENYYKRKQKELHDARVALLRSQRQ